MMVMMMMMMISLRYYSSHNKTTCVKTVSRTSLSTVCLSVEPFNLNSVSFSPAIYTSDVRCELELS